MMEHHILQVYASGQYTFFVGDCKETFEHIWFDIDAMVIWGLSIFIFMLFIML